MDQAKKSNSTLCTPPPTPQISHRRLPLSNEIDLAAIQQNTGREQSSTTQTLDQSRRPLEDQSKAVQTHSNSQNNDEFTFKSYWRKTDKKMKNDWLQIQTMMKDIKDHLKEEMEKPVDSQAARRWAKLWDGIDTYLDLQDAYWERRAMYEELCAQCERLCSDI